MQERCERKKKTRREKRRGGNRGLRDLDDDMKESAVTELAVGSLGLQWRMSHIFDVLEFGLRFGCVVYVQGAALALGVLQRRLRKGYHNT